MNYQSRIPNIPYLYSNTRIGWVYSKKEKFKTGVFWSARYVHQYFLTWESLGDPSGKHIIPSQFVQNIEINTSFKENRYSLSLACKNLTNRIVFDHFNIQRPGRYFSITARYFYTN